MCTKTGLPVAWQVESARANESKFVADLIDTAQARGFAVETCAMDRGYDYPRVHAECDERDCQPIIPLRKTPDVVRGEHLPPSCEHGPWRFAGSDYKRQAAKAEPDLRNLKEGHAALSMAIDKLASLRGLDGSGD